MGIKPHTAALPASKSTQRKKMDWVPIVLMTFKVAVFGTCMFFAIKWHHDQGKKDKEEKNRHGSASASTGTHTHDNTSQDAAP